MTRTDGQEARLLSAVRDGWPPSDTDDGRGYRRLALAEMRPVDALGMPRSDGHEAAVVVVEAGAGGLAALPVVRRAGIWRVAAAGDGVAEALVAVLAGGRHLSPGTRFQLERAVPTVMSVGERAVGVDQTNRSVVVAEALVVKWYTQPGVDGRRAATLLWHLAEVGFAGVPLLHGTLSWQASSTDRPVVLAIVDEYLAGARDGWEWCTEAVVEHARASHRCGSGCPAAFAGDVGRLVGALHVALATPSAHIPGARGTAGADEVAAWLEASLADLQAVQAIAAADRHLLVEREAMLLEELSRLDHAGHTPIQPVHGDLHVGQVLNGPDGLRVIDFDGAPDYASPDAERDSVARDIAHLLLSLELVVEVARKRLEADSAVALSAWGRTARSELLEGYRQALAARPGRVGLDERLIEPFIVRQLCHEIRYAADTLPRWRYAPMGVLARLYPATRT
ncbi:hypothetical protein BH23CHL8_BH23CHL8_22900 [soil metagenome]